MNMWLNKHYLIKSFQGSGDFKMSISVSSKDES